MLHNYRLEDEIPAKWVRFDATPAILFMYRHYDGPEKVADDISQNPARPPFDNVFAKVKAHPTQNGYVYTFLQNANTQKRLENFIDTSRAMLGKRIDDSEYTDSHSVILRGFEREDIGSLYVGSINTAHGVYLLSVAYDMLGRCIYFMVIPENKTVPGCGTDEYVNVIEFGVVPTLFSFMMTHVKGVEVVDHSKRQQRRRSKRGKGEIKYRTLRIKPSMIYRNNVQPNAAANDRTPLHLCRGHFKTYTDDSPLFGRITGTFWTQPHMRGRKEVGQVIKDYTVDAPN